MDTTIKTILSGLVNIITQTSKKETKVILSTPFDTVSIKTIEISKDRIEYTLNPSNSNSMIERLYINANLKNGIKFSEKELKELNWKTARLSFVDNTYIVTIKNK